METTTAGGYAITHVWHTFFKIWYFNALIDFLCLLNINSKWIKIESLLTGIHLKISKASKYFKRNKMNSGRISENNEAPKGSDGTMHENYFEDLDNNSY